MLDSINKKILERNFICNDICFRERAPAITWLSAELAGRVKHHHFRGTLKNEHFSENSYEYLCIDLIYIT
jgi:hypothetical protein